MRSRTRPTPAQAAERKQARTRRRFARRQWARRWLTWRYVVAALTLVALVAGGVYAVYFSHGLSVQGVDVEGASILTDDAVLGAADVPTGGPLAVVDLDAIENRVASLAAVRSVDVTRKWPHDVLISIVERTPVAVIERAGSFRAIDADGVLFTTYRKAPPGLPLIQTDADADADALREGATVAAALPETLRRMVDHVQLVSVDEIDLALKDGRTVRWGSAEDSDAKAEVLAVLLGRDAQVYDVSVPGQPTTSG